MTKRTLAGVIFAAAIATTLSVTGQVIPDSRCFTNSWRAAGYPGEIPAPARIVNVRDFGALGDGVNNDAPAISAAAASLGPSGGVVFLPAGLYAVPNNAISLPSNTVLRGERSFTTEIVATNLLQTQTPVIAIYGSDPGTPWLDMQSGYDLMSQTVVITDVTSFAAGEWVETHEGTNAAWKMSNWYDMVGQLLQVANVTTTVPPAGTLTFVTPLRLQYQPGLPLNNVPINPQIRRFTRATRNVGVENLRISRKIAGDNTMRNNVPSVYFQYAINCWVRGCEFTNVFGSACSGSYSANCEITGNYIHHAYEFDGGGSGYGVVFQYKCGDFLVENNIFKRLRHSLVAQAGANGNVFGYNYSEDMYDGLSSTVMDMSCHGNYAYANLFEGNCGVYMNLDASSGHGMNGPYNTFFRNRARASSALGGINVKDALSCSNETCVGNETASTRYNTGAGIVEWGNNINGTIKPTGTDNLSDYSYYLGSNVMSPPPVPVWWNIPSAIPVYGPTNVGPVPPVSTERDIPARVRFFGAGPKTYGPPSIWGQPTNQTTAQGIPATFAVAATGTPYAVYQWYCNGTSVPGATNASIVLPNVQCADTGAYACVVSDSNGWMRSAPASLSVTPYSVSLAVTGAPALLGAPAPYGYGSHLIGRGLCVTDSVVSPVYVAADTRQVCAGWNGSGSVPASGMDTSVTFTISGDSGLTWNWKTQYSLSLDVSGKGRTGPGSGWQDAGQSVTVTAYPSPGCYLMQWTGDVPGAAGRSNPLSLFMSGPRSVTAVFGVANLIWIR